MEQGKMITTGFDIHNFIGSTIEEYRHDRLQRQYDRISNDGKSYFYIQAAVESALYNVKRLDVRSFIIYGEPQSGKTEMMICLTAALLDDGHRMIVVLTNDSVQLLEQNLSRFQESGLDPAPKNFSEVLGSDVKIEGRSWVVFCKKNQGDLSRLLSKVGHLSSIVVIDDEADFASPDGRVNGEAKTRINALITRFLVKNGIYIGVTATPARLDLNGTFDNDNEKWVNFAPHDNYTGQNVFFPTTKEGLGASKFGLRLMPDTRDDDIYLRTAALGFLVNVAYLHVSGERPQNYSMLIHTSGKKADHADDQSAVIKLFRILADSDDDRYEQYLEEMYAIAEKRYPGRGTELLQFVLRNIGQHNVVLMNSNADRHLQLYRKATNPSTLFTIAIGGNLVSRGVTFNNLLSMFFTRDVKHKMQQHTYIQRARMFGSRGEYLRFFELYIPKSLYGEWQRCFVFHKLSLNRITDGLGAPMWIGDSRIKPAAANSINLSAVQWKSGEMYWGIFELTDEMRLLVGEGGKGTVLLRRLSELVGVEVLPPYVLEFIEHFTVSGDDSVAVHGVQVLTAAYGTADAKSITREKGLMGTNQLEVNKYPKAIHHIKMFANEVGQARVYYKYVPKMDLVVPQSGNLTFMSRDARKPR